MQERIRQKEMIMRLVKLLGELNEKFVYVGGCATGFLITDLAAPDVRITSDIDCIVNVVTKGAYHKIEAELRQKGFMHCLEKDAPICRWVKDDLTLDVVPADNSVLEFSNRWYKDAILHAKKIDLGGNLSFYLISAPYFFATKYEAFRDRGKNDFYSSHDLEDIVALIDGRIELPLEIENCGFELRAYLSLVCTKLLSNQAFLDVLPGHLASHGQLTDDRVQLVSKNMKKIVEFIHSKYSSFELGFLEKFAERPEGHKENLQNGEMHAGLLLNEGIISHAPMMAEYYQLTEKGEEIIAGLRAAL
jgi:predicted nucleotidyltransferase